MIILTKTIIHDWEVLRPAEGSSSYRKWPREQSTSSSTTCCATRRYAQQQMDHVLGSPISRYTDSLQIRQSLCVGQVSAPSLDLHLHSLCLTIDCCLRRHYRAFQSKSHVDMRSRISWQGQYKTLRTCSTKPCRWRVKPQSREIMIMHFEGTHPTTPPATESQDQLITQPPWKPRQWNNVECNNPIRLVCQWRDSLHLSPRTAMRAYL